MLTDLAVPGLDEHTVFRSLFFAYPDGLLLVDLQGRILLANPAAADLLGYSRSEFVGLPVDQLVPDAIRPRHAAYRQAYAEHPRPRPMGTQMDLVAKRRDGSEVVVEIALSPLQDHGLPYVVAAIRGVGAYPRVRQALQRARYAETLAQFGRLAVDERDTRTLLEHVPFMVTEALQIEGALALMLEPVSSQLRIVAGNGLLPDEAVGGLLALEPSLPPGRVVALGQPVLVNNYADEPAGARPSRYVDAGIASELAVPLSDHGRTIGVLCVRSTQPERFQDDEVRFLESLSNLLSTVLQRARTEEALNHSQRLESVGQLTGGIAHDFNNLLTVISGNLQLIEDTPACAEHPAIRQSVAAASRAARRGAELTAKLLAFSRRQVLESTVVDAAALLRSLTDMLRRTLDQRIVISLDVDDALCVADPTQLESALLNIAINARDAMPQGGTLAFSCKAVWELPADLDAPEAAAGTEGYVAIAIADSGIGMSEVVLERAFEPFFTTKERGRGTGLGLSTVYGFGRQSRGAVALRSRPGEGTTVTLYLPRVREDMNADDAADASTVPLPEGLHVLLVEDDADVLAVVHRFLIALGCEITQCGNAEQALTALSKSQSIDFLLSDIALGSGMRGSDLVGIARIVRPGLPVLLMSGFSGEMLEQAPSWPLLRKPCTRDELRRAMVKVLNLA